MTHENIVMFLEKIENERFHNDSVHPKLETITRTVSYKPMK